jgi:hypothetical protein
MQNALRLIPGWKLEMYLAYVFNATNTYINCVVLFNFSEDYPANVTELFILRCLVKAY